MCRMQNLKSWSLFGISSGFISLILNCATPPQSLYLERTPATFKALSCESLFTDLSVNRKKTGGTSTVIKKLPSLLDVAPPILKAFSEPVKIDTDLGCNRTVPIQVSVVTPDKITNLTGVNDPFEVPARPHLIIHTDTEPEEASTKKLLAFILSIK